MSTSFNAFEYQHQPLPLPFDAAKLNGLSERLVQSHWQNNYGGAVKALNAVRSQLTRALGDESTPPYLYNGLKREQLVRTGSVILHELYFGNLGGDGKAPGDLRARIGSAFGTFDAWESEFRQIGQGLGGGSGWVVLGYNTHLQILENYWMADHSTHAAETRPVLVMDMYEHAYQMDYGAAAGKYVDAFFANIQWDVVASRL
jgi:Fe-Mn family superoxide dismutase